MFSRPLGFKAVSMDNQLICHTLLNLSPAPVPRLYDGTVCPVSGHH